MSVSPASLAEVTAEFPVLRRDPRLVYLDSAATSQTPMPVIDAMTRYYTESRASIHRGVYPLAVQATDLYEVLPHGLRNSEKNGRIIAHKQIRW